MARDLEIFEADSEIELKALVEAFIDENSDRIVNVQYACYTDIETEEFMYSAGIIFEIYHPREAASWPYLLSAPESV